MFACVYVWLVVCMFVLAWGRKGRCGDACAEATDADDISFAG